MNSNNPYHGYKCKCRIFYHPIKENGSSSTDTETPGNRYPLQRTVEIQMMIYGRVPSFIQQRAMDTFEIIFQSYFLKATIKFLGMD